MLRRLPLAFMTCLLAFNSQQAGAQELQSLRTPNFNWTGAYIGAHAGWQAIKSEGFGDLFFLDDATRISDDGWLAGGQIGFNKQVGHVVIGFELSGSWDNANENSNCFENNPDVDEFTGHLILLHHVANFRCRSSLNWTMQGLGKIGYAIDDGRLLPYAIGGVALSGFGMNFGRDMSDELPGLVESSHFGYTAEQNLVGAVFGGGVQYAVGHSVSIGVEYLHADYGRQGYRGNGHATEDVGGIETSLDFLASGHEDLRADEVRAVFNYNFSER